jgi:hypothetical protein
MTELDVRLLDTECSRPKREACPARSAAGVHRDCGHLFLIGELKRGGSSPKTGIVM